MHGYQFGLRPIAALAKPKKKSEHTNGPDYTDYDLLAMLII